MLEKRIRPRCQSLMTRLFVHGRTDAAHYRLDQVRQEFGLTDVAVIKVRRDSKIIASAVHPAWGPVAVKTVDPIANPVAANSAAYVDRYVLDRPASFLPELHACGYGFAISHWVDGPLANQLGPHDSADSGPFLRFFGELGSWCGSDGDGGDVLTTPELLAIVQFYIETTVRRMQYTAAATCIRACVRFVREQQRLRGLLDTLGELGPQLKLPRTIMISDLNPNNLVLDRDRSRLVLIDYEALRPGSYLFDLVFFASSMLAGRHARHFDDVIAGHVLSRAVLPSEDAVVFFRSLAQYVVETFMTIDGRAPDEIRESLARIPVPAGV